MKASDRKAAGDVVLGMEGGGTRTSVLMIEGADRVVAEFQTGPAVLPLMSDRELAWHLRDIAARLPVTPRAIGIGMAGVRADADRLRLARAAQHVWPGVPLVATNDLETGLEAARRAPGVSAQVLIISGTGSCCLGRTDDGRMAKVGGRGHIIGDRGSACDIGLRGLRGALAEFDHTGRMGLLGQMILGALVFNEPEQLIPWSIEAKKTDIASLCVTVMKAAQRGDKTARDILAEAARLLAEDAVACAGKLRATGSPVQFIFNGAVLLKNAAFRRDVAARIRALWPAAKITPLRQPSVWGAVALARRALRDAADGAPRTSAAEPGPVVEPLPPIVTDLSFLKRSPTEQRNPRSLELATLPLAEGIRLMLGEEARTAGAVAAEAREIEKVITRVIRAFSGGGRLFYAGAGTSGRLGVLDASEIPPTFRAPREQVQGIIAGGRQALWSAVEGAEDDVRAGALAVENRGVDARDVLIGIAASGRTPFVWGAIAEANKRGAFTVLLAFNPAVKDAFRDPVWKKSHWMPAIIITPDTGAEVLTGSTRLKAGTATKLVLNTITTLAMSKAGKVISNLMVDLNPSNIKLRDRAVRILDELTGCGPDRAKEALRASGWRVKEAWESLTRKRGRRRAGKG